MQLPSRPRETILSSWSSRVQEKLEGRPRQGPGGSTMRQLGPELGVAGGAPSGCPGCGGEGRRRPEREQLDLAEPEHERPEKSDGLPVLHDDEIGGHVADLGFKT